MSYFKNIPFDEISEDNIYGDWLIETRFMREDDDCVFCKSTSIKFLKNGTFCDFNETQNVGTWTMVREVELIYNPVIYFYNGKAEIGSAIITRFITNALVFKLTLYFSTGLELIMEKQKTS